MMNINKSSDFSVNLNNFTGPLDVLLDLAKSQKVNLEDISITKLADQFHDFITKASNLNLELASDYLLMATWLTYLKSKLLLPTTEEEEFKILEVAKKLKLQLKRLELIRLLSDQMLKRKRLGRDIFLRGNKANIRSAYTSKYTLTLFEILKSYSSIIMMKDFQRINIPKLPVFTMEEGIKKIKDLINTLHDWRKIEDLVPSYCMKSKNLKKSGIAGLLAGSLELVKEGNTKMKQNQLYDSIYIKEK